MSMNNKKLIWQIFPPNLLITLIAMIAVSWYGSTEVRNFYFEQLEIALQAQADLIKDRISELLAADRIKELREFCLGSGREAVSRITVVDRFGHVLADSDEDPDAMGLHNDRPEIIAAFKGDTGKAIRFSKTLQENMLYVAVRLKGSDGSAQGAGGRGDYFPGVLRVSVPVTAIERTLENVQIKIAIGSIVVIIAAALITLLVSRRISRPLEEMKQSAERFSQGDFSQHMSLHKGTSASLEVAALAGAMDKMAEQLNERIRTILRQRNELEAVSPAWSKWCWRLTPMSA